MMLRNFLKFDTLTGEYVSKFWKEITENNENQEELGEVFFQNNI